MALSPERQALEDLLVTQRAYELARDGLSGRYDTAHLRAIHRHLFQDCPRHGLDHLDPGHFRDPLEAGEHWTKLRVLEGGLSYTVAYSRMNLQAVERMEAALAEAQPARLRGLGREGFVGAISKLYGELDYVHPFREGNSRTLRAFTRQLARESGFDLGWAELVSPEKRRRDLYLVRDKAVNEKAVVTLAPGSGIYMRIQHALDMFEQVPSLERLLEPAVRVWTRAQVAVPRDPEPTVASVLPVARPGGGRPGLPQEDHRPGVLTQQRLVVREGLARLQHQNSAGAWQDLSSRPAGAIPSGVYPLNVREVARGGDFIGPVLHASELSVYQLLPGRVVRHKRQALPDVPEIGSLARIRYDRGQVTVERSDQLSQGRSRGR